MLPEPLIPLATDPTPIYGLIGVVVTALLVFAGNRLGARGNERGEKAKTDLSAGELALKIANRADAQSADQEKRLTRLEAWRRRVLDDWWPRHDERDRLIEAEVRRLDPAFVLPDRVALPPLDVEDATSA